MGQVTESEHSILVVDDDEDLRELLADVLRDEGYSVQTAKNGLDALSSLRQSDPPCLILLDLMMPVMNGFQFLEELRRDPALSPLQVAVVTAHGSLGPAEKAALAAPILTKPVAIPKLLELVGELC